MLSNPCERRGYPSTRLTARRILRQERSGRCRLGTGEQHVIDATLATVAGVSRTVPSVRLALLPPPFVIGTSRRRGITQAAPAGEGANGRPILQHARKSTVPAWKRNKPAQARRPDFRRRKHRRVKVKLVKPGLTAEEERVECTGKHLGRTQPREEWPPLERSGRHPQARRSPCEHREIEWSEVACEFWRTDRIRSRGERAIPAATTTCAAVIASPSASVRRNRPRWWSMRSTGESTTGATCRCTQRP